MHFIETAGRYFKAVTMLAVFTRLARGNKLVALRGAEIL